eukprot:TRINITY_DN7125_c0_g1_i1.p1 TRINITY_DN7125_c0_g1~~TRINITY_DN7125_c0_g1_i1.p1  ORF type:complete len:283 (+),score=88.97 TRINITY_DN7125_c0_g1_i1:48-851(+)
MSLFSSSSVVLLGLVLALSLLSVAMASSAADIGLTNHLGGARVSKCSGNSAIQIDFVNLAQPKLVPGGRLDILVSGKVIQKNLDLKSTFIYAEAKHFEGGRMRIDTYGPTLAQNFPGLTTKGQTFELSASMIIPKDLAIGSYSMVLKVLDSSSVEEASLLGCLTFRDSLVSGDAALSEKEKELAAEFGPNTNNAPPLSQSLFARLSNPLVDSDAFMKEALAAIPLMQQKRKTDASKKASREAGKEANRLDLDSIMNPTQAEGEPKKQ